MSQLPGPAEFAEHEGDHTHRDVSGGALRAATFGAMRVDTTTAASARWPTWRPGTCTAAK